jgi:DNA-binding GntR family transcriptional regulator
MRIQLLRLQTFSFIDESDRYIHLVEYSEISEAVLEGNTKRTEKLMRAHMRRMLKLISKLPQAAFLNSDHQEHGPK